MDPMVAEVWRIVPPGAIKRMVGAFISELFSTY
jgi:hypothetical protein